MQAFLSVLQSFFGAAAADAFPPPTQFVMKLKANITKARLLDICNELGNPTTGRFSGQCASLRDDNNPAIASSNSSSEDLAWSFQAFSVLSLVSAPGIT